MKPIHDDAYQFLQLMNQRIADVEANLTATEKMVRDAETKKALSDAVLRIGAAVGYDEPTAIGLAEAGEFTLEFNTLLRDQTKAQLELLTRQRDRMLAAFD